MRGNHGSGKAAAFRFSVAAALTGAWGVWGVWKVFAKESVREWVLAEDGHDTRLSWCKRRMRRLINAGR